MAQVLHSKYNLQFGVGTSLLLHVLVFSIVLKIHNSTPLVASNKLEIEIVDIVGSTKGDGLAAKPREATKAPQKITAAPKVPSDTITTASNVTPAAAEGGTISKESGTGQFGIENGRQASAEERYSIELRQLIEKHKVYPMMAKKLGIQGRVTVRFVLNNKGEVLESTIAASAPSDVLNKAALELVKRIHGVKPFPEDLKRQTWLFEVPVDYKL